MKAQASAGAEARRGGQELWVTLTAEGLRVLPGQLPFQRPAGEGKAYRAEPAKQTGWAWCKEPLLPALGGWGWELPTSRTHTACHSLVLGWREAGPRAQPCRPLTHRADGSHLAVTSLCGSSVLGLAGPSTCHALLMSNLPLPR